MSGPYSQKPYPFLDQLRNLNINPLTLINGDTIQYNSANTTWENQPLTGGGTANLTGTDNFAVFKSGTNGVADPQCISRVPGTGGCAMVINPGTKSIGLGISTPVLRLEVNGAIKAAGAASTNLQLIPSSSAIGMVSNNPLNLFSNNALTSPNATIVDGVVNNVQSSSFRSYPPSNFDAPNTTDKNSIYKIKLQNGMDLWTSFGIFNNQSNFSPTTTSFPTGQIVEYQNERPIQYPKIIGQFLTSTNIPSGANVFTTYFGTTAGGFDECIYDPMGMRAFKIASDWAYWGAPTLFRTSTAKFIINVKLFLSGDWAGSATNDSLIISIEQYRSGTLFTSHELARTTYNSASGRMRFNCERTFLGFVAGGSEEFIADTDYYNIQIHNIGTNDFTVSRVNVESEFIFAQ